jgi:predicted phosphate transport protein (TIGR00153 family)
MNIDKFLKFFVPKDHSFYPLFEQDAENLVTAAALLQKLMSSTELEDHERIHKEIKEIEHIGDQITDKTYQQLNKSFITPFDREDIHELAGSIDDVVDSINGISRRICLYKPKNLMPVYKEMAEMIVQAAKEIKTCVHCLNDAAANKNEITEACNKVTDIEHKADEYYFIAVSELFEKETNPAELLKNNKILEILERCVDEEEDVTDVIKAILIKMA